MNRELRKLFDDNNLLIRKITLVNNVKIVDTGNERIVIKKREKSHFVSSELSTLSSSLTLTSKASAICPTVSNEKYFFVFVASILLMYSWEYPVISANLA